MQTASGLRTRLSRRMIDAGILLGGVGDRCPGALPTPAPRRKTIRPPSCKMRMRLQRGIRLVAFADHSFGRYDQLRHLDARRLRHVEHERQKHADQHAELDRNGHGRNRRQGNDPGVEPSRAQVINELLPIDESPGREHENAGQAGFRNVVRVGCKQKHRQSDGHGGDHARPLRPTTGLLIDRGPGERAGAGKAVKQAADEVGDAFAQALLVDIELSAACAAAMALAMEIASSSPSSAMARPLLAKRMDVRPFDMRQFKRRQLGRNVADDFDATPCLSSCQCPTTAVMQTIASNSSGSRMRKRRIDPAQCEAQSRRFPARSTAPCDSSDRYATA